MIAIDIIFHLKGGYKNKATSSFYNEIGLTH